MENTYLVDTETKQGGKDKHMQEQKTNDHVADADRSKKERQRKKKRGKE